MKTNLDPFHKYTDAQLRIVVKKVGLKETLLETDESALSLSIGQRQLLSLARILLRDNNKIVVMDEPTSNIDQESDQHIQKVRPSLCT